MRHPRRRVTAVEVLRLFVPIVALVVAGAIASNYVRQANGPFRLAVLLNVVPVTGAIVLLHGAKKG